MSPRVEAGSSPERDLEIERLTRRMRGSLAGLRAAAEALERFPGMEEEQQRRLHSVLADESGHLSRLLDHLEQLAVSPGGEAEVRLDVPEMLTLVSEALSRPGLQVEMPPPERSRRLRGVVEVDASIVRSALRTFATSLRRDFALVRCRLQAEIVDAHLLVDCSWLPGPGDEERLQDWHGAAMEISSEGPALRPAARRHGGEAWFDLDRDPGPGGRRAHVRLLLPIVEAE